MWLVPLSLLSNIVGTFTSRRSCLTIMRLFVHNAKAAVEREEESRRRVEVEERRRGKQPGATAGSSPDGQDPQAEQQEGQQA
jgi:hypothetical protein